MVFRGEAVMIGRPESYRSRFLSWISEIGADSGDCDALAPNAPQGNARAWDRFPRVRVLADFGCL